MANMINNQGIGLSTMTGINAGQLANVLSGAGENQAISQQQLSALFSSLSQAQIAAVAGAKSIGADSSGMQNLANLVEAVGAASESSTPSPSPSPSP